MSLYNDLIDISRTQARASDGSGNNPYDSDQGAAGQQLIRITYADYEGGVSTPEDRGNAREISNAMADLPDGTANSFGSSQMFIFFGQFIDHDIDLVGEDPAAGEMITVVPDDDPAFPDGAHLTLHRSSVADGTGTGGTPREHINNITSYLDASNVYGSSQATTDVLRDGAYMITNSQGGAAGVGDIEAVHGPGSADGLYIGNPGTAHVMGDIRSDENIALTSIHEIWMKEHNYQVDRLKDLNLGLNDEELFQTARMIVEAEYQKVVYDEWLPELIGHSLPGYAGYRSYVDASISNEFAGAAFRFGHTMLPTDFQRLAEDGTTTQQLGLFDAFFQPHKLDQAGGVSGLVRGLAAEVTSEFDAKIIDDVRNLLFGPDSFRDLATLNIMRGRDQGVPTLNEVRSELGFDTYSNFYELTSDTDLADALSQAYGGDIDNVDLWVGILAEDKVYGAQVGETLQSILIDQFARLRDGDRFYYENRLADTPDLLAEIESSSFSEIIARNTGVEHLQEAVFKAYERLVGDDYDNSIFGGDDSELIIGLGGDDTLHGGGSADEIYGGDGNDDMFGDDGHDILFGEDGNDYILAGSGNDHVEGGAGNDVVILDSGHDYALGGDGNDAIYGGAHNDVIDTGNGNDVARGGTQHDRLFGDAGQDRLFGDQGIDRLYGESGGDKLYGGADRDYLFGGDGNDKIYGQSGNDKIDGGRGFDKLYGGSGRDEFNMGHRMGTDQVYGFNVHQDKLNVGSHFNNMQQVYNHAYDTRSGTVINFGGGDKVLLVGVSLDDLGGSNFKFGDF